MAKNRNSKIRRERLLRKLWRSVLKQFRRSKSNPSPPKKNKRRVYQVKLLSHNLQRKKQNNLRLSQLKSRNKQTLLAKNKKIQKVNLIRKNKSNLTL